MPRGGWTELKVYEVRSITPSVVEALTDEGKIASIAISLAKETLPDSSERKYPTVKMKGVHWPPDKPDIEVSPDDTVDSLLKRVWDVDLRLHQEREAAQRAQDASEGE